MNPAEPSLVDKVLVLHRSLDGIGHAFGGALALAYYTDNPRATADVDINVALEPHDAVRVLQRLPNGVAWSTDDVERIASDEQVRLWWGRTPVDLFFRASDFHDDVAQRAESHRFGGVDLPFLAALDLATFKALFDRPKDWLDIASMASAGSIDIAEVAEAIRSLIGNDDRVDRLLALTW